MAKFILYISVYGEKIRGYKMRYVNLFLKDEQVIELKAISTESGAPVSELIRRAIDKYLVEKREKEAKEKEKSNKV